MGFSQLTRPFLWSLYSIKLIAKIESLKSAGVFTYEEAENRDVRLVEGIGGSQEEGNWVRFFCLVDKEDGILIDVRFKAYGQSALIGAAEVAAELMKGKNYDQVKRISADLIDKEVRDKELEPAFPKETFFLLNLVLEAMENVSLQCTDLPLPDVYFAPPAPHDLGEVLEGGIPGWKEMTLKTKLSAIESVLDREIRPYIALDAGGVEVVNLLHDHEVIISYQGSCTSCYSSIGTTLSFIQQILRAKVYPDIVVIPKSELV